MLNFKKTNILNKIDMGEKCLLFCALLVLLNGGITSTKVFQTPGGFPSLFNSLNAWFRLLC